MPPSKKRALGFPQLRRGLSLVRPFGLAGLLLALAILVMGYALGLTLLYRPLIGGPATHPLTALGLALLGLCVFAWRQGHLRRAFQPFAWVALALGVARLAEIYLGLELLSPATPFTPLLNKNQLAGTPIATGANTAAMLSMMALAALLNYWRKPMASQVVAFLALGFPLVGLVGYAYGLDQFHGRMSLSTALIALPVGFGLLLASGHRGFVRAILSPWIGGRIARFQLLLGFLVPFLLGYAALYVAAENSNELYGLLIVLTSLFIGGLITYSAVVQEAIDQRRRVAERHLIRAASRDPLTGLPNRRHLFEYATSLLARGSRERTPSSLLLLDLDHFKELNDRHGHLVGDAVLVRIARLILENVRGQDIPARFGGEEFIVLLPNTDLQGAVALAEKLRIHIEAGCQDLVSGNAPTVTASFGCAECDSRSCELHTLILQADIALYQAKSNGRNRVEPPYSPPSGDLDLPMDFLPAEPELARL